MAFALPYVPKDIAHLTVGTHIKALITHVHDRNALVFTIRIVNLTDFRMTDIIENGQYLSMGHRMPPLSRMFGLGINKKIFRAIRMPTMLGCTDNYAYLIDIGCTMLLRTEDPMFHLSPLVQSIPGTAIVCQYADIVNQHLQPARWQNLQQQIFEGAVCVLRVESNIDAQLQQLNSNASGMSGFGPAACWLAHKRIESWSRIAKERVDAMRRITLDRNSDDNGSCSGSGSGGGASGASSSTTPPPPMTPPPSASSVTSTTSGIGSGAGSYSDSCDLLSDSEEVSVTRESHPIQPPSMLGGSPHTMSTEMLRGHAEALHSPLHLHHQSRSFPPRLQRTPSISSQSSVDSAPSRQSGHRGSSPQIRTFGPDGRSSLPSEPAFPHHLARSPSPMRTISLDARCGSPGAGIDTHDLRTPSPSQTSLISLAGGSAASNMGLGFVSSPKAGRSLSPLLIPPRAQPSVDPTMGPASPLGAIQPDLYRVQDGPIYLTAPASSPALGRLHLRVKYDYHLFDLTVHLIEAHNLCPIEEGGFRDPYVRLLLDPEVDNRKRQTQIHRGETNPYFDQHFKFPVSRDQLQDKELLLQVLDYDRYSHNDIIGEVRIAVGDLDLSKSVEIWGDLLRIKKPQENRPELLCSLNYLPQAERLTVVIMKAKNLDTLQEPYIKIYLIQNGKRVKKKKTSVSRSDDPSNPIWNEAFTFNLQSSYLQTAAIEIYVVGTGGEVTEIGSCGLGPQERGTGCQHWHDMINNARKPTAMWHFIR